MGNRFGSRAAIKMIKDAGFDCYDYSMYGADVLGDDYREKAEELKKYADEIGIACNQAHAPFEIGADDEFVPENKCYLRLIRSIEAAAMLGADNIIVHAIKDNLPPDVDFYELNTRFYKSLVPYCERFKIHVSVENLFGWNNGATPVLSDPREHMEFVRGLGSEWMNICVDVGHSAITGHKPEEVIGAMDSKILKALHIHDNGLFYDDHLIPYAGKINWDGVTAALKKIGYSGEFTFEIFGYLDRLPDALIPDALKFAEKIGRYFIGELTK